MDDLIDLPGHFPLFVFHNVCEEVSPIIQGRLREGCQTEYLGLLEGELIVEKDLKEELLNLLVDKLRLNH